MGAANRSFEQEAEYLDPRSGVRNWRSLPLAAHDVLPGFSDLDMGGDLDYDITQQAEYQLLDQTFEDAMNKIEVDARLPYSGSSYMEVQHERPQGVDEVQSESQLAFKQDNPDLVDTDTHTNFGGVSSPEKAPRVTRKRHTGSYHCPRCDKKFCKRGAVKGHFSRCIVKLGNPKALRWDDHISLQPTHKGGPKDQTRNNIYHSSLEAYSGVVVPSKLLRGQSIVRYVPRKIQGNLLCAVCGGGPFAKTYHLKSHFITCVKQHGNPTGANWYDLADAERNKKLLRERPDVIPNAPPTM